ncbi:MAG: KH domain-containing protein [Bryocella sp.]
MTDSLEAGTNQSAVPGMKQLMVEIVQALVDDPAAVKIEAVPDGDTTVLRLEVATTDIGKVIGKQGRTARSLRTILGAASMKYKHRFALDIVEAGEDAED